MRKILVVLSFLSGCIVASAMQNDAKSLLVEAESFSDYGGWVHDILAFGKTHSAHLLAHGAGRPVADAVTRVAFPQTGTYHVYVSTYNWTSPWYDGKGPGAFQLLVNGSVVGDTLGVKGNCWEWQYAGDVNIKNRSTIVALHDLTGFEGRVDAVWFTKGTNLPERKAKEAVRHEGYDLVVVGGGIPGTTAALTAARKGLKVVLVDNMPWLGGNAAMEVRICGLGYKNLYPNMGYATCEVAGIKPELKNDPDAYNVNKNGIGSAKDEAYKEEFYKDATDPRGSDIFNAMKSIPGTEVTSEREKTLHKLENRRRNTAVERERLLAEAGVDIYHNIQVYDLSKKGSCITSVRGKDLKNSSEHIFSGKLFVDATGDGTVGYLAGAEYMYGREGKDFASENAAPEKPDDKKMGSSILWQAFERTYPTTFPTPAQIPWALQFSDEYHIDRPSWSWKWEAGMEMDSANEPEKIRDHLFRAIYGNWAYLKNNKSKYKGYSLDYVQHRLMKRESRRIVGDYVLNENDIANHVEYPDASFTSTWTMDLHYADARNARYFPGEEFYTSCTNADPWSVVDRYHVPYRCLYSKDISNLFLGGRNLSVSHVALGTVRVMFTLGQAAEVIALAASICNRHNATPREVYTTYFDELKDLMKKGTLD